MPERQNKAENSILRSSLAIVKYLLQLNARKGQYVSQMAKACKISCTDDEQ